MNPAVVVGFDAGTGALFGLAACNRWIRCWSIRPIAEIVGRELNYTPSDPTELPLGFFLQLDYLMSVGKTFSY